MKPFFSEKARVGKENIVLVDDDKMFKNELEVASVFNQHFNKITTNLDILPIPFGSSIHQDPVPASIEKYASHPSVVSIRTRFKSHISFDLTEIS